jgi:hypothetical protein
MLVGKYELWGWVIMPVELLTELGSRLGAVYPRIQTLTT